MDIKITLDPLTNFSFSQEHQAVAKAMQKEA